MNPPALTSPSNSDIYTTPSQHPAAAAATAAAALSHDVTPVPNASSGTGRKRKAAAVPGSRGVANLTPEQLQKKRANDREAQRAIRERTKNTIEALQDRIKELEGQQPFQELQRVVQERDRALAECEQLRNKLAVVQSIVSGTQPSASQSHTQTQAQPSLHGRSDLIEQYTRPLWLTQSANTTELATLTAQQSPLPPLHNHSTPQFANHAPPPSALEPHQQHLHPELRSPASGTFGSPASAEVASAQTYAVDPAASAHHDSSTAVSYNQRLPPPAAMVDQSNGERLGLDYVLEPKHHLASASPSHVTSQHFSLTAGSDQPLYARLTRISAPTCPLDELLINFVVDKRKQLADGVPLQEVIGPDEPTFDGLRDPGGPQSAKAHPISALLTEILFKFPGISGLAERVAVHFLMFSLVRWQICPCEPCFMRMPSYLRPIKEQYEYEHAAWADQLQWPFMRHQLITGPEVKLEDFFIPFTSKVCVNWPYSADLVLLPADDPSEPSQMNPVFYSHLRKLENWSLGSAFSNAFPHLVDHTVRIEG